MSKIDEFIRMFEDMLKNAKWGFEDDEWYEPLKRKGIMDDDEILSDNYYDAQCVAFTLKVLKVIRGDYDSEYN